MCHVYYISILMYAFVPREYDNGQCSGDDIEHLGVDPGEALSEVNDTKGAHARFSYLRRIFKDRLLEQLQADNDGDLVPVRKLRKQTLRIYLLYLVGITLFTGKSVHYVNVVYLRYFRDLELVAGNAWGAAALARLYREINNASHYNKKHLLSYLSLLHV